MDMANLLFPFYICILCNRFRTTRAVTVLWRFAALRRNVVKHFRSPWHKGLRKCDSKLLCHLRITIEGTAFDDFKAQFAGLGLAFEHLRRHAAGLFPELHIIEPDRGQAACFNLFDLASEYRDSLLSRGVQHNLQGADHRIVCQVINAVHLFHKLIRG